MSDDLNQRRMDAYYYDFDGTGCDPVDKILSAVACAGKAYHHTSDWNEETRPFLDYHSGETPIDWIKNAAQEAAERIEELEAKLEKAVTALKFYRSAIDLRIDCEITHAMQEAHDNANTTLAQLEGDK